MHVLALMLESDSSIEVAYVYGRFTCGCAWSIFTGPNQTAFLLLAGLKLPYIIICVRSHLYKYYLFKNIDGIVPPTATSLCF
jgi:hypothetical protein